MRLPNRVLLAFVAVVLLPLGVGVYFNEFPPSPLVDNEVFQETWRSIGEEYPLEGILARSKETENPPVVLLVHGSGVADKNETIYLNTPFLDLAHGLAEYNIATYRYDKRFFTYPQLAQEWGNQVTYDVEILEDVAYAIEMLTLEENLGDIYVLGHSLGGMLTPAIASLHPQVKGIISMAGSPQPLYEISYQQNKAIESYYQANPMDTSAMKQFETQMAQVEEEILTLRGDFSHLPDDTFLLGLPVAYQRSAKQYAGVEYLEEMTVPMLILQGEADFQVLSSVDYALYQSLLSQRENVTFCLYPNLNHMMMESSGEIGVQDYYKEQAVSPLVVEDIAKFIHQWSGIGG